MFNNKYNNKMSMFDGYHIAILIVFAIVTFLVLYNKKKFVEDPKKDKIFRYSLASTSLFLELVYHIWILTLREYSVEMLPILGVCASVNILTIISLYLDKGKLMEIVFYWACTGAFFSLVFVDISYAFPHFRYFHYFINHYNFLLAAIYYVATKKAVLTRKTLYISCSIIFVYSLLMLGLDLIFDKNWFYMLASPVQEVSDTLGKPWYTILWIISITLMLHGWHGIAYLCLKKPTKMADK